MLDIRELIRRLQLGETDRQIARDVQVSRKTVSKYRVWAQQHDVLTAPLPDAATLQAQLKTTLPVSTPPAIPSKVTPFRDQVATLRQRGVECRAIYDILREHERRHRAAARRTAARSPAHRIGHSQARAQIRPAAAGSRLRQGRAV